MGTYKYKDEVAAASSVNTSVLGFPGSGLPRIVRGHLVLGLEGLIKAYKDGAAFTELLQKTAQP